MPAVVNLLGVQTPQALHCSPTTLDEGRHWPTPSMEQSWAKGGAARQMAQQGVPPSAQPGLHRTGYGDPTERTKEAGR
jgi:hypothetical protein